MIAGDIVLAYETIASETQARGIALVDHAAHLVAHGVLHILGHDHDSDEAAEMMEGLERRVLASLGIADPYAEACASAVQEERS